MATINIDDGDEQRTIHNELILSFTLDGEIIQFNQECERVTGYLRTDIIHKKVQDILLPNENLSQWESLLHTIQQTTKIDEVILPLKTNHNTIYPILWNGFFIKDDNGVSKNICLFGTSQKSHHSIAFKDKSDSPVSNTSHNGGKNKINEKKHQTISFTSLSGQHHKRKEEHRKENIHNKEKLEATTVLHNLSSLVSIEKIVDNTSKQVDDLVKMIKDLSRKYDTLTKRLGELERKDKRQEKNHKHKGKHLKLLDNGYKKAAGKTMKASPNIQLPLNESSFTEKKPSFLSDPFGYTRQHRDLDIKIRECEHRKKELEAAEAQILKEKKIFNSRIEEFCQWRDKLEHLEMEIEKRRQELLNQDLIFLKQAPPVSHKTNSVVSETADIVASEAPNFHQILDNISQSAAIIQRGILKQINATFAELIGYPVHEIVEKNFFDFIATEGLAEVEKYYFNRLKGESITSYTTVFSTKENEKVFVEVNVKPTIYNGEKAEIAIITNLEKEKQDE